MSRESFNNEKKPLSIDEAREEANMMRGKVILDREIARRAEHGDPTESYFDDRQRTGGPEITQEEYKKAAEFVDKLKEELEKEPEIIKDAHSFGRLVHGVAKVIAAPVGFASVAMNAFVNMEISSHNKNSSFSKINRSAPAFYNLFYKKLTEALTDPAKRTEKLEKIGAKYGEHMEKEEKKKLNE